MKIYSKFKSIVNTSGYFCIQNNKKNLYCALCASVHHSSFQKLRALRSMHCSLLLLVYMFIMMKFYLPLNY